MVVLLAALAVTNVRATSREHRATRLASDAVSATVVVTADAATQQPGTAVLTISVTNTGPVLQLRSPRVESPGFRLEPIGRLPQQVGGGETVLLTVRLRGGCRADDVPPRVVARVVPPSGRLHEVSAGISPDLTELLCGRRPLTDTTDPSVLDVRPGTSSVAFALRLANRSRQVLYLDGLAAEGLQLTVAEGSRVLVAAGASTTVQVRLSIASCTHLPTPLDTQRTDTLPFAAFEIALASADAKVAVLPYLADPGTPLYGAVRALAHRTCPRF